MSVVLTDYGCDVMLYNVSTKLDNKLQGTSRDMHVKRYAYLLYAKGQTAL